MPFGLQNPAQSFQRLVKKDLQQFQLGFLSSSSILPQKTPQYTTTILDIRPGAAQRFPPIRNFRFPLEGQSFQLITSPIVTALTSDSETWFARQQCQLH